jgi:uncharacterized protein (DUF58 family)
MSKRQRIYIFPNRFGFLGFGLFLTCVIVAASFQNNLVFIYAFALLAMGLIAILQTARTVRGIELLDVSVFPGAVNEKTTVRIRLKNNTRAPKYSVVGSLDLDRKKRFPFHFETLPAESVQEMIVQIELPEERGVYKFKRVEIESNYPYGLFTAWIYLKTESEIVVYPKPFGRQPMVGLKSQDPDEIDHLRPFEANDSWRRVDWRKYAQNQTLVVKEYISSNDPIALLDWNQIESTDFSTKLAQMSAWILEKHKSHKDYEVWLPEKRLAAGRGDLHFKICVRALAVLPEVPR